MKYKYYLNNYTELFLITLSFCVQIGYYNMDDIDVNSFSFISYSLISISLMIIYLRILLKEISILPKKRGKKKFLEFCTMYILFSMIFYFLDILNLSGYSFFSLIVLGSCFFKMKKI